MQKTIIYKYIIKQYKDNCIKSKRVGKRKCKYKIFIVVRRNPTHVHFLQVSIPSLRFHWFKASKPSLQGKQLDYGSNPPSWTFDSKHPLQSSKYTSFLNNLSSDIPHLRISKWYLTLGFFVSKIYKWIYKIISQNYGTKL